MADEKKNGTIINIRFNGATLAKLDELIKKGGYKSRSDCVKSLIEERYSEVAAAEGMKRAFLELLKEDPEIYAALAEAFSRFLSEREEAAAGESA